MSVWTYEPNDDDTIAVFEVETDHHRMTAALNGRYPTRLAALEGALNDAEIGLYTARSRVRKLRARIRRERSKA